MTSTASCYGLSSKLHGLGAVSLLSLIPPSSSQSPWLDMKSVQDSAQLLGKTLYHSGDLSYFEAVNKEALRNALYSLPRGGHHHCWER